MQLVASAGRVEAEAEAGHVYGPEATPPRYNAFTTALLVDCSVNKAVEGGECPGLIQIITGRFRESGNGIIDTFDQPCITCGNKSRPLSSSH